MQTGVFQPQKPDFSGIGDALAQQFKGAQMGQAMQQMPHQQQMNQLKEALAKANIGQKQQQMQLDPLKMQLQEQQLRQQQQPKPTSLMKNIEWLKQKGMGDDQAYQMAVSHMMGPQTRIRQTKDGGFELLQGQNVGMKDVPGAPTHQIQSNLEQGITGTETIKPDLMNLADIFDRTHSYLSRAKSKVGGVLNQMGLQDVNPYSRYPTWRQQMNSIINEKAESLMKAFQAGRGKHLLEATKKILTPNPEEDPNMYRQRLKDFSNSLDKRKQIYNFHLQNGYTPQSAAIRAINETHPNKVIKQLNKLSEPSNQQSSKQAQQSIQSTKKPSDTNQKIYVKKTPDQLSDEELLEYRNQLKGRP